MKKLILAASFLFVLAKTVFATDFDISPDKGAELTPAQTQELISAAYEIMGKIEGKGKETNPDIIAASRKIQMNPKKSDGELYVYTGFINYELMFVLVDKITVKNFNIIGSKSTALYVLWENNGKKEWKKMNVKLEDK